MCHLNKLILCMFIVCLTNGLLAAIVIKILLLLLCNAYGSLGATGGSMATRRCSYRAAFKLKLIEYAERHGNRFARSPESVLSQCGDCARYIE